MEEKITAYIARDENGALYFYSEKPFKSNEYGAWEGKLIQFPQVKWEDEKPTKVELTIKICE
jgi:hypothetical protein